MNANSKQKSMEKLQPLPHPFPCTPRAHSWSFLYVLFKSDLPIFSLGIPVVYVTIKIRYVEVKTHNWASYGVNKTTRFGPLGGYLQVSKVCYRRLIHIAEQCG